MTNKEWQVHVEGYSPRSEAEWDGKLLRS